MSSLLVLQDKENIVFASDTASSIRIDDKTYRVSNREKKIFLLGELMVFASGNKVIRDLFINLIGSKPVLDDIEIALKETLIDACGEYSLQVVVAEKPTSKGSKVFFYSSYNGFNREESLCRSDEVSMFTAGIKTIEIATAFESNYDTERDLTSAIKKSYIDSSCELVGGSVEIHQYSNRGISSRSFKVDSMKEHNTKKLHADGVVLIFGERIFGKIISGVNLAIEDESGIWVTRGSRTTIYDRNGREQMRLGLVTDAPDPECFGTLLDNGKHRVHMTSCDGFMIEKWEMSRWEKKMYADLEGNFWVKDFTAQNITIEDYDGYFRFEGNKGRVSDGNKDVMWLGYIPSAPCTSHDFGIVLDGINGSTVHMTSNRGFAIDVNCENKFSVDNEGSLYAQDVIAHNLRIVDGQLGEKIIFDHNDGITINGNNQEQIRLNANEGIAIDVSGQRRIWIGKDGLIYGKKIYIMGDDSDEMIKDVDGSYISDLTVNRLKTLNSNDPQNYVHIEDNYLKFMTRYNEIQTEAKYTMEFVGTGVDAYPRAIWGAGAIGSGETNVGYHYKTQSRFAWEYIQTDGSKIEMALMNTHPNSIMMDTPHGIEIKAGQSFRVTVGSQTFVMDEKGIRLAGTRIDLN